MNPAAFFAFELANYYNTLARTIEFQLFYVTNAAENSALSRSLQCSEVTEHKTSSQFTVVKILLSAPKYLYGLRTWPWPPVRLETACKRDLRVLKVWTEMALKSPTLISQVG